MTIPYPSYPNQSLYGSFPNFPMTHLNLGINVLGKFYGIIIPIPNIPGIPNWIFKIFEYIAGWGGAYFSYLIEYAGDWIANMVIYVFGFFIGIFDAIFGSLATLTAGLGIFAIPVDMIVIGILLIALVLLGMGIMKGIQAISEMIA